MLLASIEREVSSNGKEYEETEWQKSRKRNEQNRVCAGIQFGNQQTKQQTIWEEPKKQSEKRLRVWEREEVSKGRYLFSADDFKNVSVKNRR